MNLNFRSTNAMYALNVRRFLQGGPMGPEDLGGAPVPPEQGGAPEGAPAGPEGGAPQEGGNPEELMQQIAQQLVDMLMQQIGDPQAVSAVLQMALEMVQGGGQEAPEPLESPVYGKGGRLLYRIRK